MFEDQVDDATRFGLVHLARAAVIDAIFDANELYGSDFIAWRGKRDELSAVEVFVRECDQVLVSAAVVPHERFHRQPGAEAGVENALRQLFL